MFTLYHRLQRGLAAAILILAALTWSAPAIAFAHGGGGTPEPGQPTSNEIPQELIKAVSYDQNVGAQVPLDLKFTDETGKGVALSDYFGSKPVMLIFAYYDCPMLCNLALNDLTRNLKDLSLTPGKDFTLLTISFDPKEGPDQATQKKAVYMQQYQRPEAAAGWHFLTGSEANIAPLTKTIGFHYVWDAKNQEYAHPTGVVVMTPQGKISRYIFGISYGERDLRLALVDASNRKIASPVDQFFLLCYHYNPVSGQYDLLIFQVLKIAGIGTVLLLAGGVIWLSRSSRTLPGPPAHPQSG